MSQQIASTIGTDIRGSVNRKLGRDGSPETGFEMVLTLRSL